jgi:hypothetical protein
MYATEPRRTWRGAVNALVARYNFRLRQPGEGAMQYVTVAVASDLEAERLKQDLAENPGSPLLTPRWGNAVHATLATESAARRQIPPAPGANPSGSGTGPGMRSEASDRARIREAAVRATEVYPGPVGELLSRELLSWDQFGYRLGSRTTIMQIVDQILGEETAEEIEQQIHAA